MHLRISRLPELAGIDIFWKVGAQAIKLNSFHSSIEWFRDSGRFLSAVYSFLTDEHKFEPGRFHQAIHQESALLKLLNVKVKFRAGEQRFVGLFHETEKRILGYFKQ
jgi:hypothetical protein